MLAAIILPLFAFYVADSRGCRSELTGVAPNMAAIKVAIDADQGVLPICLLTIFCFLPLCGFYLLPLPSRFSVSFALLKSRKKSMSTKVLKSPL